MKKLIILFIIIVLLFSYNKENSVMVFSYEKEEIYDNYYINFKECDLNTNNFIEVFSYLNHNDFKILEITPYHNLNNNFLFYTNDLKYILNKFKNDYIDLMIDNSAYTTNICIKEIKINTSNKILDNFKNVIDFSY